MGSTVIVLFMAVEKKDISLPIKNWMTDLGGLLQNAHDHQPESGLYMASGRRGIPLYLLTEIRNVCQLPGLDFLDDECTTLQGTELVMAIQSLTVIINELLSGNEIVRNTIIDYLASTNGVNYQQQMYVQEDF